MTEFKRGMITGACIVLGALALGAFCYFVGRDVQRRETLTIQGSVNCDSPTINHAPYELSKQCGPEPLTKRRTE